MEDIKLKIRQGFVSNSSSSSFVICGSKFGIKDVCETLNLYEQDYMHDYNHDLTYFDKEEFATAVKLKLLGKDGDNGFEALVTMDDNIAIGQSWALMGDDLSKNQFKKIVQAKLEKIFNPTLVNVQNIDEEYFC